MGFIAGFIARLGPWLGRAISATPALLPKLVSKLKVAGGFAGNSVGAIVTWAKANPLNAVMIASTLASLGFSVSELIDSKDDAGADKFKSDLDKLATTSAAKAEALLLGIGAKSEQFNTDIDDEKNATNAAAHREVLLWARSMFGSPQQAMMAHKYLQAFVEMPISDVRQGYEIYNLTGLRLSA